MANRAGTYGLLVDSCRTLQFDYDVPHFRRVISMFINLINLIACIAASTQAICLATGLNVWDAREAVLR